MSSLLTGLVPEPVRVRAGEVTRTALASRAWLWTTFAVVHGGLLVVGLVNRPGGYGDLSLYRRWIVDGFATGWWPVLDFDWVYPAGALVPMTLAGLVPGSATVFLIAWILLVTGLDAIAVGALLRRGRGLTAAWWWVGFIAFLGPVALGRLDAIVAPLVILALLRAVDHPRTASALLTAAAWIKVAPGALMLPLVIASRRPWRDVVLPAAAVCLVVAGSVVALGGTDQLASFLAEQGERGLQLEAVGATPWMLAGLLAPDTFPRLYNRQIITYEVHGPGTPAAGTFLDVALPIAIAGAVALMIAWRVRAGRRFWTPAARLQMVTHGGLLVVLILLVTNKVFSPQFVGWIAPPVAVALAYGLRGWRRTAAAVLVVAFVTQFIFPWSYPALVYGVPGMTLTLAARNLLIVWLLIEVVRWFLRKPELGGPAAAPERDEVAEGRAGAEHDAVAVEAVDVDEDDATADCPEWDPRASRDEQPAGSAPAS
ncbi:glycosyltransferase 87 family protein [Miniimonas sp. S16]|uniref:glycosyltransferase 87 family protein n=1 Tax=Miniimonas sp. S16 TaxID=2171623 RepID=UPI000D5258AB|nr:glycosyltransferase 87 family protein [Miniimonas sp. S16]